MRCLVWVLALACVCQGLGCASVNVEVSQYENLGQILADSRFMADVFERRHRLFPSGLRSDTVLPLAGVEQRVFEQISLTNQHLFKVVEQGQQTALLSEDISSQALRDAANRTTVVVNKVQNSDSAIDALVRDVYSVIGFRPNINMYVAPMETTGLSAHHDPQDVFIVQTSGSKTWKICNPIGAGANLPTRVSSNPNHRLYFRYTEAQLADADCEEVQLSVGDVLYMPRGTIHAPYTTKAASVHLTVGLDSDFRWQDFITGLMHTGSLPAPKAKTLLTCLKERDLNKLVPHGLLAELKRGNSGQIASAQDIPSHIIDAFGQAFRSLDWALCPPNAFDFKCSDCIAKNIHLMHTLQVQQSRQSAPLWRGEGPRSTHDEEL